MVWLYYDKSFGGGGDGHTNRWQTSVFYFMADTFNQDDVVGSIQRMSEADKVEQFLFGCLERRFGREKLDASDYSFNLTLPPGYRVLTSTVWVEAETSNGGISQFFWNRYSDYQLILDDARDAYAKIGAQEQATAIRNCLELFGQSKTLFDQLRTDAPLATPTKQLPQFCLRCSNNQEFGLLSFSARRCFHVTDDFQRGNRRTHAGLLSVAERKGPAALCGA